MAAAAAAKHLACRRPRRPMAATAMADWRLSHELEILVLSGPPKRLSLGIQQPRLKLYRKNHDIPRPPVVDLLMTITSLFCQGQTIAAKTWKWPACRVFNCTCSIMFHQLSAKSIHCWGVFLPPPRFWGKYGRADCSYSWRNMMAGETTSWWMRGNKKNDSITTANLIIFHNHS